MTKYILVAKHQTTATKMKEATVDCISPLSQVDSNTKFENKNVKRKTTRFTKSKTIVKEHQVLKLRLIN